MSHTGTEDYKKSQNLLEFYEEVKAAFMPFATAVLRVTCNMGHSGRNRGGRGRGRSLKALEVESFAVVGKVPERLKCENKSKIEQKSGLG